MIKKLMQGVCFLIIFGSWAIAAHAQTTDTLVRIDDPTSCTGIDSATEICVQYTGPTVYVPSFDPLDLGFELAVSNPPGEVPDPSSDPINCASDSFGLAFPLTKQGGTEFSGCAFSFGTLTNDAYYTISISDPSGIPDIPFTLPGSEWQCPAGEVCSGAGPLSVTFTPEPSTSLLYVSGLLLFLLVGFFRKRFRVTSNVVAVIGASPRASFESIA